jgi:hypothetical protein
MSRAGFRATAVTVEDLSPMFRRHGVPFELSSCHMGVVAGYVTVGHVPAADVTRLLRERPRPSASASPACPTARPAWSAPTASATPTPPS